MRRSRVIVTLAVLLPSLLWSVPTAPEAGAGTGPQPAAQVDITPPTIEWGPCEWADPPAECADVDVPLDYDDPSGPTTTIAVLRMPARGERIGTLFVNPGGPGGSAAGFATVAARLIGPGVRRRFDVVGIDPRGVGGSGSAWCRGEADFGSYPVTKAQTRERVGNDRALNEGCAERRSVLVDHASTADVARDMDVVRQALGEEQITYYGISYGSLLGQTYAAMFPDRIRAMIIDGVLDAVEWTRGNDPSLPMTYRLRSGRGAYESLTSVLNECDRVGKRRCPIAGHANETWRRVVRKARAGELRVDGWRPEVQDVVGTALGALYSPYGIGYLVSFLAEAERSLARTSAPALDRAWAELQRIRARRDAAGPYGYASPRSTIAASRSYLQFESVICGDAVNPHRPYRWAGTSRVADRRQPWFGRLWTWHSSVCAQWQGRSGEDAFRGPWATTTSYPLLVVGNAHDPATPISGARTANRLFADSVLLLLNGWGHGALDSGECVRTRMAAYLIDRTLPAPGTVCRSDVRPYPR